MSKLTKAESETLTLCMDWSAPYEVADRRRKLHPTLSVYPSGVARMLSRLQEAGLVAYGAANNTFRITDAGRTALSSYTRSEPAP